jgi:hypothetical protein
MLSKYHRNKMVDASLRGVSFAYPATMYAAFLTAVPDASDSNYGEIGSTTANGYARQAITSNTTNWAATNGVGSTTNPSSGTTGQSSNNIAINFPNPSGGNWFTGAGPSASLITGVGLFDGSTIGAGNLLFYIPITPKYVNQTDFNISIPIGALVLNFDN